MLSSYIRSLDVVDSPALSTRSVTCLLRNGLETVGAIEDYLGKGNSLRGIRNIGVKCEAEILAAFNDTIERAEKNAE